MGYRRKGQGVGIDFAVGMAVFVLTVAFGIYYVSGAVQPSDPFSGPVERASLRAVELFQDRASWKMMENRVYVNSSIEENSYPIELSFAYPEDLDPNSSLIKDEDGTEIASQQDYSLNETVFLPDLGKGMNRYGLVYTTETNLDDREYTNKVSRNGDTVSNSQTEVRYDRRGIDQLSFSGVKLLKNSDFTGADSTLDHFEGPLRILTRYNNPDLKEFRVFGNDDRVRFFHDLSDQATYRFTLTPDFGKLYVSDGEQIINISGPGNHYSGTTDFADFYYNDESYGLSLVSKDMDVTVSRQASGPNEASKDVEVQITVSGSESGNRFLVYPHTGNYQEALDQKELFYNPPQVMVSVTQEKEGLSRKKVEEFDGRPYKEIRADLGLGDLKYNLSVGDILDSGRDIPQGGTVSVYSYPVQVLGRWGNFSSKDFRIGVWN